MMESYSKYEIDAPESGTGEYRTRCPQCENTHKTRGHKDLSVNLSEHTWFCHRCGWTGGLHEERPDRREYAKPTSKRTEPALNGILNIKAEYDKLQPLTAAAIAYLASRGISKETAEAAGLKSAPRVYSNRAGKELEALAFPVMRGSDCLNIKYRPLEVKDFAQTKGGDQTALFNADSMAGTDTIIFTEGEFDTLAVLEAGYPCAVSTPNGAPPENAKNLENKLAWLEANREAFDAARQIVLAMDRDAVGVAFEKVVAAAFGVERCLTVEYPAGNKDANDVLVRHGKDMLRRCIDAAKPCPVAGITTFAEHAGEITAFWRDRGRNGLFSTGIRTVDDCLLLQPGTLNILTGIPSHGKSEFLDQIIINTIRLHGWSWAIYSPENYPIANHFQKLAEKWTSAPLFNPSALTQWSKAPMTAEEVRDAITTLSSRVKILTSGDDCGDDLDGILQRVEVCARRDKVKAFVLDPWNEIEHKRPAALSETEYISMALTRLRNFARRFNLMCWVVAHPAKLLKDRQTGQYPIPTPWDISGSAHWRNKADVCLCVWRDVVKNDGLVQVHIQKVRNKNAGTAGKVITLHWTRANGIISEGGRYSGEAGGG
ncbi:MAG: toprim domain-containing protein [Victivallaceae bacterium]|nr:toprim domain-containing protein [Victivallaceae bacterium]